MKRVLHPLGIFGGRKVELGYFKLHDSGAIGRNEVGEEIFVVENISDTKYVMIVIISKSSGKMSLRIAG